MNVMNVKLLLIKFYNHINNNELFNCDVGSVVNAYMLSNGLYEELTHPQEEPPKAPDVINTEWGQGVSVGVKEKIEKTREELSNECEKKQNLFFGFKETFSRALENNEDAAHIIADAFFNVLSNQDRLESRVKTLEGQMEGFSRFELQGTSKSFEIDSESLKEIKNTLETADKLAASISELKNLKKDLGQ